ncbi:unnamed protein product, partial [Rodentolepis nana]|uniref:Ovule protein n=1 Tax=Rodentolepis nana TaxID=102285 RepID=A0A0R3TSD6_RODNA
LLPSSPIDQLVQSRLIRNKDFQFITTEPAHASKQAFDLFNSCVFPPISQYGTIITRLFPILHRSSVFLISSDIAFTPLNLFVQGKQKTPQTISRGNPSRCRSGQPKRDLRNHRTRYLAACIPDFVSGTLITRDHQYMFIQTSSIIYNLGNGF